MHDAVGWVKVVVGRQRQARVEIEVDRTVHPRRVSLPVHETGRDEQHIAGTDIDASGLLDPISF